MPLELTIPQGTWNQIQTAPHAMLAEVRNGATWHLPVPWMIPSRRGMELARAYWCIVDGAALCIARGYEWDGASIPWLLRPIVGDPFAARNAAMGLIHDVLYGTQTVSRSRADAVLHDIADRTCEWTPTWRTKLHANVVWSGVCIGGWWAWCWNGKASIAAQRRQIAWWSRETLRMGKAEWETAQDQAEGAI